MALLMAHLFQKKNQRDRDVSENGRRRTKNAIGCVRLFL
jgi:hypothetical protein